MKPAETHKPPIYESGGREFESLRARHSFQSLAFSLVAKSASGLQAFCKTGSRGVLQFEDCALGEVLCSWEMSLKDRGDAAIAMAGDGGDLEDRRASARSVIAVPRRS